MFRIITNEEYGKTSHMPHGGKMDQRLTTLEETLDSVSESVIDKLIPAVIKMQKDVKVSIESARFIYSLCYSQYYDCLMT